MRKAMVKGLFRGVDKGVFRDIEHLHFIFFTDPNEIFVGNYELLGLFGSYPSSIAPTLMKISQDFARSCFRKRISWRAGTVRPAAETTSSRD